MLTKHVIILNFNDILVKKQYAQFQYLRIFSYIDKDLQFFDMGDKKGFSLKYQVRIFDTT